MRWSHIIPIEKKSEADEPLLWNIYGHLVPIVLPYKSFLRLSISYTSHSLNFHKTGHHINPIGRSNHPISYPYMGHVWAIICHIKPVLLLWWGWQKNFKSKSLSKHILILLKSWKSRFLWKKQNLPQLNASQTCFFVHVLPRQKETGKFVY